VGGSKRSWRIFPEGEANQSRGSTDITDGGSGAELCDRTETIYGQSRPTSCVYDNGDQSPSGRSA
jgi:hypothetical protein